MWNQGTQTYLLDTGLMARLHGYSSKEIYFRAPNVGAAFEEF